MRINGSLVVIGLAVGGLGCNALFGIGAPEPLPPSQGGAGGKSTGGADTGGRDTGGAGGQTGTTTSSSSTTSSSTTGTPGPCGDGVVGAGEECDPGDPVTGAKCTSQCTIANVLQIVAGTAHTCALFAGGLVKCWGFNGNGELGLDAQVDAVGDQPGEMGAALAPVSLGAGQIATKLAAGANHTCALLAGGTVKCWGLNASGQLGQGDLDSRGDEPGEMGDALKAVDLGPNAEVTDIAAGSQHTCAVFKNGNLKCWGRNEHGQLAAGDQNPVVLGDEPTEMGSALPVAVGGAQQVAAGDFHTCALFDDGTVRCWGYNNVGQLGTGDAMDYGNAVKVPSVQLTGIGAMLWAGGNQSCALQKNGAMKCWGDNTFGQIGAFDLVPVGDDPVEAANLPEVFLDAPPKLFFEWSMGKQHTCATFPSQGVKCWGRNNYGQLGLGTSLPNTDVPPLKSDLANIGLGAVSVVGAGAYHACAFSPADGMRCWGRNQYGQLGLGTTADVGTEPAALGMNLPRVRLVSDSF